MCHVIGSRCEPRRDQTCWLFSAAIVGMTAFKLFIGGPSQSGKSTTAQMVCDTLRCVHLNLDRDSEIIRIKQDLVGSARSQPLKRRCRELISQVSESSVIEGSPLNPEDILEISNEDNQFIGAFCGYPTVAPEKKLEQLEASGFRNAEHLRRCSEEDRLARIKKYIRASRILRDQCGDIGLPFFDYSDLSKLSLKQSDMVQYFQNKITDVSKQ